MTQLNNQKIINRFNQIADLLEIKGENRFKVLAYRRAAENIANLGRDINQVWQAGELKQVPGIGKAIHDKIVELLSTGELTFWHKLTTEIPESLTTLLTVPGIGPKTVKLLWQTLNITTINQLKIAAQNGQLSQLPGIGPKTQTKILTGIKTLSQHQPNRVTLDTALLTAKKIIAHLQTLPAVLQIQYAGSLRRFAPTIGDLDILVATHHPEQVMETFKTLPELETVLLSGPTKTSIRFLNGLQADLRCLDPKHWGTALQYFSGSKAHNIKIRELAQKQNLSLNEYAFTRTDKSQILCHKETQVYNTLGLPFIPPVLREDRGEIEAALANKLPTLVQQKDIKGEVHCHSTWSDGKGSIEEMTQAALSKGYEYLVITDHSQSLGIANGLNAARLQQQRHEIETVQTQYPQIKLLQGIELEIKANGSLDFDDEILKTLDFVVAAIHSSLTQDRKTLMTRVLNAIYNPYVNVLAHPTGRLLGKRQGGDFNIEAILQSAAETGTMLEINASPKRLDLDSIYIKRAIEVGATLIINCDAHHPQHFNNMQFGIATAQRGWASKKHIGNTYPLNQLLAFNKKGT